jgi:hypothetical protein
MYLTFNVRRQQEISPQNICKEKEWGWGFPLTSQGVREKYAVNPRLYQLWKRCKTSENWYFPHYVFCVISQLTLFIQGAGIAQSV